MDESFHGFTDPDASYLIVHEVLGRDSSESQCICNFEVGSREAVLLSDVYGV